MHRRPWKVPIVKGASQGIGAGIVAAYRRHGHAVVATSRSMALSMDSGVLSIAGDVRDRSAAERLVAVALARFGRIDTLVNNAGIFLGKPFTEYTAEEFTNVVDANLAGFFHTMQHVLPHMLRQGSGHIVQITTTLVHPGDSRSTLGPGPAEQGRPRCRDPWPWCVLGTAGQM